jgi:membrane protease subunit HflK
MFNLNDPRWGRGEDNKNADNNRIDDGKGPNQGPPDLDELWRDFNRKLGGLFGGRKGGGGGFGGGGNGNFQPDMKSAGVGAGLIAIVVV